MNQYNEKYKFLTTDGDGTQTLFEGRPYFVMSENCRHKTNADKKRHGMWIYAGTKSLEILKKRVAIPANPECEIIIL